MKYLISFCLGTILSFSSLMATEFPVTTLSDQGTGSLREAISTASSGDTISFDVVGVILLDSQLVIDKNLVILGPGADQLKLSGQDRDRIFLIEELATLILSGLDLAFGNVEGKTEPSDPPVGGLILCRGVLFASQTTFHAGKAVDGGGIALDGFDGKQTYAELENCAVYDNTALGVSQALLKNGGGILADARNGGQAIVIGLNLTIVQNEAERSGGGVFLLGDPAGGARLECTNCTIADNTAEKTGGVDNSQAEGNVYKMGR